jgi:hypothetical protein
MVPTNSNVREYFFKLPSGSFEGTQARIFVILIFESIAVSHNFNVGEDGVVAS